MKKKVLLGALLIGMAGLAACGDGEVESRDYEMSIAESSETSSMEMQSSESQSSEEQSVEPQEPEGEKATFNKYEEFLNGNEKLYFHQMVMNFPGADAGDEGYLLEELMTLFKEQYWGMQEAPKVEYAYMDCGNDGVSELAVRFVGMGIYEPGDDSALVYIIKEVEGQLELCYSYETWARSEVSMNQKGYITSGGSNGASNHGFGAGYIDGMGKWNYLYYQEEEADLSQLAYYEALASLPEVAANKNYQGNIIVSTTTFEDLSSPEAYYNTERFYTYYVDGVAGDVYAEGVYKDIFEEAGVKVYLPDEIQKMIADKEAAVGVTEDIKNAPKITWEKF